MHERKDEDERELQRLADELFLTTDAKDWRAARALFVDGAIDVDMSSLAGGGAVRMSADDLIAGFKVGLHAGKTSHHLVANYRIRIDGEHADVFAHGYAWNHVPALGPDLWETWGTYQLSAARTSAGWRLDSFRYVSKMTRGNDLVRIHAVDERVGP